jgi:hypothetical protein
MKGGSRAPAEVGRWSVRRHSAWIALGMVAALHVALTLRFEPLAVIFGPEPITTLDYETHYQQNLRAAQAFDESGRLWSYNPHLLAGQLSGTIFDADNKLYEVFTIALGIVGIPLHTGHNLFVLLAHLLVGPILYSAARLFGLDRGASTLVLGLGSACWFFDSFAHFLWWVGMVSYGFASVLALLPVALFYRWLTDRRPLHLVLMGALLGLIHTLHPYSFFVLVVPMGFLYVRARSRLSWQEHLAVAGCAVFAIVCNLWWLAVAFRFWHYILDSAFFMDVTASILVFDYLGLLKEPSQTGVVAVRSAFRFLALFGGLFGLLMWRRERDERFELFAVTLGTLLCAAYLGGYLAPLRQIQPYRFSLPATFFAVIPAAAFLMAAVREWRETQLPRLVVAFGLLAILVVVPRFARDMIYFLPEAVPRHTRPLPAPPGNINGGAGFGTIVWPEPFDFSHSPIGPHEQWVTQFVHDQDDQSGRWLVEWWALGEHLAWATDAQILGGFREFNLAHSDANWFRRHPDGAGPEPEALERYFEQYNVKWVVVSNPVPALESRTDLLKLETTIFGTRFYRTRVASSYFVGGGPGEVTASLDRIEVRGSRGGDLVLRYHYLETLQCRPGCSLYRAETPGDRVGFIGVRDAPPDFIIENPP